ncbi:circadian clock-controlled protein daywake-like [Plutella xylostella]|uniref:circadian clock-controlled protein daywake-like n=1 Tax=Plutella xylostella TaxID=51655 RepID=UPI002032A004|nr:circadian clock-controlled protein daywake-like [Plutella xylostella]
MGFYKNIVFLCVVGLASCAPPPAQKCKLSDSECMKTAFQQYLPTFVSGIPELGVEVLDVMDMEDIKFDLSGLKFTLQEGKLKGLKSSIIDGARWDMAKKRLHIDFHNNCTIRGHYTASGRILILPITGDGNMKLKLRNLVVKLFIDFDMGKNDEGKDIIVAKKFGYEYDVIDNVHYDLSNLFNGNKELSETMLTFLNQNWKQIVKEFGTPMMNVSAKKIYKNIATFLKNTPLEDIVLS